MAVINLYIEAAGDDAFDHLRPLLDEFGAGVALLEEGRRVGLTYGGRVAWAPAVPLLVEAARKPIGTSGLTITFEAEE